MEMPTGTDQKSPSKACSFSKGVVKGHPRKMEIFYNITTLLQAKPEKKLWPFPIPVITVHMERVDFTLTRL